MNSWQTFLQFLKLQIYKFGEILFFYLKTWMDILYVYRWEKSEKIDFFHSYFFFSILQK